jgi:hypothetical protein
MTNITSEELIRYLYNETSEQKAAIIRAALQIDWNLRETYEKLTNARENLDKISFKPRTESVNKILEYASKREVPVSSH